MLLRRSLFPLPRTGGERDQRVEDPHHRGGLQRIKDKLSGLLREEAEKQLTMAATRWLSRQATTADVTMAIVNLYVTAPL